MSSHSIQQAFSQMSKTASTKRKVSTAVADGELLGRGSRTLASASLQRSPTAPKSPARKKSRQDLSATSPVMGITPSSQRAIGKTTVAKGSTSGKPTASPTTAFGSKIPARMPTNRAPGFGKARASTVTKPSQGFSLSDPFSSAASSQSGGLFGKQQVQGRNGIVVTPELAPGFAAMQLEGAAYRNLNIDPMLYEETFSPAIPPAGLDFDDSSLDATPRAQLSRRSSRNDLDLLVQVLEAVESIKLVQKEDKKERKKTNTLLETLTDRIEKVEDSVKNLATGDLEGIRVEVAGLRTELQLLELGSKVKPESAEKSDVNGPMTKLVKTYRAAFYEAMQISDGAPLPAPLTDDDLEEHPESSPYYLIKSSDTGPSTTFRPNFNLALGKQPEWHASIISIVKQKGESFGEITADSQKSLTDANHKDALGRCFKSLKTAYQYQHKVDEDKEQRKQANRRRGRRTTLASARQDVRHVDYLPPILLEPEWDFVFDAGYTSEQWSADEEAITANTELVGELGKGNKFDIICSPEFQRHEVTRIKHEIIDRAVQLRQVEDMRKLKGPKKGARKTPTTYDDRLVERDLPPNRKLPFFALDEAWVAKHNDGIAFINPFLGSEDSDTDELVEIGTAKKRRDRGQRAEIYEQSLQLLEDYKPGAAGGLLDHLALSAKYPGAGQSLDMDVEEEVEGEGGALMSELEEGENHTDESREDENRDSEDD